MDKAVLRPEPVGKVLVHCREGVSRSASIVIAYLMIRHQYTVENAIKEVITHRWIRPNPNFQRQLVQLEFRLRAEKENDDEVPNEVTKCVIESG